MIFLIALTLLIAAASAQRPTYAGISSKGYPELASRFRDPDADANDNAVNVVDRLGADNEQPSENLPTDARGDNVLVNRLNQWPRENQPFWLINAQHLERHRHPNENANRQQQTLNTIQQQGNQQRLNEIQPNLGGNQQGLNREQQTFGINQQSVSGGINQRPELGGINQQPVSGGINQRPELGGINQQPVSGGINLQPALDRTNQQPVSGGINQRPELGGINQQTVSGGINQRPELGGINQQPVSGGINQQPDFGGLNQQGLGVELRGGVQNRFGESFTVTETRTIKPLIRQGSFVGQRI